MTILVVGGTGYLGSAIVDHFSNVMDVIGCSRLGGATPGGVEIDVVTEKDCRDFCRRIDVDTVVLALGDANLDRCESDFSYSYLRNVVQYKKWFDSIKYELPNAKVILFSSIYVFGEPVPAGGYDEMDVPIPMSKYGIDKLETEQILNEMSKEHLVIRLPWLVGNVAHTRDPIMKIIDKLMRGEELMLDRGVRYPTSTSWVADATLELIQQGASGVVHISGHEGITRFELVHAIASAISPSLAKRVSDTGVYPALGQFPVLARRPTGAKLAHNKNLGLTLPKSPGLAQLVEIYMIGREEL